MKRRVALVLPAVFLVAGCAVTPRMMPHPDPTDENGFDPVTVTRPNPAFPNIFVDNGQIVVDQEPIHSPRVQRPVIQWRLDRSSAYVFASNGIEIADLPGADCRALGGKGKVFTCTFLRATAKLQHKYWIRVMRPGQTPVTLDPTIMND